MPKKAEVIISGLFFFGYFLLEEQKKVTNRKTTYNKLAPPRVHGRYTFLRGTFLDYFYNFNPTTGNLIRRQNDKHTGLTELFQYDNLDRLLSVQMDTTMLALTYDGNTGGILSKSDAGTFNYDGKPYTISSIDPAIGFTSADTADIQDITYTSFQSISSITKKNYEAGFLYNPDNQRARMLIKHNGNTILTRWYSNGSFIKESDGSNTKVFTFIGGDASTAPVVAITENINCELFAIGVIRNLLVP